VDKVEIQAETTGAEAPETTEAEPRVEGLPEKFNSVDDLVKSYQELEKKLGESKPEEPVQEEQKEEGLEIAEKAADSAGLNMDELVNEYQTEGKLSDKTYESFEKVGISKEYVDSYIAGQEALISKQSSEIKSTVGGDEAYNNMVSWAAENLTATEQEAYNKAVNSGDMETIKLAVSGLQARYVSVNGQEPNLIDGKSSSPKGPGYDSWAQVTADMNDPRYQKDPAFRAEIQAKLENSNI
jgi:hypothetical protein